MVRLQLQIFCLVMLLLLGACAGIQPQVDTKSSLEARVTAYWQHKIKHEFEKAYLFESPTIREKGSLSDYIKTFTGKAIWKDATIKSVSIEGSSAIVHVKITYIIIGIYCPEEGLTTTVREYWQLEDGIWYHHFKRSMKNKKKTKEV